jgi:outer membrane immunogenic protein
MKKLAALLAFSTVLAFGATAKAADMVEAPMVYDWTGFYIGGNLGYAFGGSDDVALSPGFPDVGEIQLNGFFGGGQIGGDWEVNSFVFGALADIEYAATFDDTSRIFDDGVKVHASDDIDWWGTVRGRAGWAFDRFLIYGTGGLAWANVNYTIRSGALDVDESKDSTRVGYTVGGGLAWAVADHWTVGAEYLYVNLGKYSVGDNGFNTEATPDFHSVKGVVNFKF